MYNRHVQSSSPKDLAIYYSRIEHTYTDTERERERSIVANMLKA